MKTKIARQMVREVGSNLGSLARTVGKGFVETSKSLRNAGAWTAKNIGYLGCKATYPIMGNMSRGLQERFEETVGKRNYNAYTSFKTSLFTNALGYIPMVIGLMNYSESLAPTTENKQIVLGGVILGGIYTAVEGVSRFSIISGGEYDESLRKRRTIPVCSREPIASLAGKMVSLPFELGFATRDYLGRVRKRAERAVVQGEGK